VGGAVEELEADDTDQDDAAGEEKKFQQLLKGSWQHLSDEAKDAYRLRMQKLRDRIVTQFTRKEKKSFWIRVTSFPFSPFF
jgi:RNase adaptor protein for sRNA GlmZ degradation